MKLVILDRDGVINHDSDQYIKSPEEWKPIPGSLEAIARLRGRVHRFQDVPLIVTYHPAYLLRNLPDKARAWEDLCLARRTMRGV